MKYMIRPNVFCQKSPFTVTSSVQKGELAQAVAQLQKIQGRANFAPTLKLGCFSPNLPSSSWKCAHKTKTEKLNYRAPIVFLTPDVTIVMVWFSLSYLSFP